MRHILLATLLAAPLAAQQAVQQPAQKPAAGLILGRVVEATSNEPVANAIVTISEVAKVVMAGEGVMMLPDHVVDGEQQIAVLTDSNGQFLFSGLKAGSYRLGARRNGYHEGQFGARRPDTGGDPIVLKDDERRGDVTIRIWKYAAITGTITDEHGDPIVNAPVRAFVRTFVAGHPRLGMRIGYATTDDRGVYRLFRLLPGDYIVGFVQEERAAPVSLIDAQKKFEAGGDQKAAAAISEMLGQSRSYVAPLGTGDSMRVAGSLVGLRPPVVAPGPAGWLTYPTVLYPGVAGPGAARAITLRSGDEISGIDLQLRPVPTRRVAGVLTDANGPVARFPVRLLPAMSSEFETDDHAPGHATVTDDDGRFVFPAVVPGDYVIRGLQGSGGGMFAFHAIDLPTGGNVIISSGNMSVVEAFEVAGPKPGPTRYAFAPVAVVDRDVANVAIGVSMGVPLTGAVEFLNRTDKPNPSEFERIGIVIEALDGRTAGFDFEMTGEVDKNGKLETVGLPPGRYLVKVPRVPEGWSLDAVMFAGRDVSDQPLEVGRAAIDGLTIRLTNRPTVLAGSVAAPPGTKNDLSHAIVLAFPTDRAAWRDYGSTPRRLQSGGVSGEGTYEMRGLPPGEYYVIAVRDDFVRTWQSPAFLESVSTLATRVTITRGDRTAQSLTLTTLPAGGR